MHAALLLIPALLYPAAAEIAQSDWFPPDCYPILRLGGRPACPTAAAISPTSPALSRQPSGSELCLTAATRPCKLWRRCQRSVYALLDRMSLSWASIVAIMSQFNLIAV